MADLKRRAARAPRHGRPSAWVRWLAHGHRWAVLGVCALVLGTGPVPPALAQTPSPNLAELRMVIAVRDARGSGNAEQTVATAQAYLAEYAEGRYADEAWLALAAGYRGQERPELALQAYNRLIEEHRESPFREQALTESLPLLTAQGDQAGAFARVDALVQAYPNSLQRSEALLWKAGAQYTQQDHAGALATLKRIDPQQHLAASQEADYYRLQTLSLVKSGESAWTPLQRYLQRDDTPEHKAEVLMLVGAIARKAERNDEALRYYRQVVEDYPVAGHLQPALFWRAQLFARTRLADAPEEVRGARRETAIGYYAAYLESGDEAHRAEALLGRGELQRAAGRPEAALADYEEAVRLNPRYKANTDVARARVALLKALGKPEQAVALLSGIRTDPDLTGAERTGFQVEQAALHYDAQECEQVEALLNPMPIISDPKVRPRAFFMRGFCRYRQGQWEKSTFDLEPLINEPEYQALALQPLLDAYEKSGQASRLVNLTEELLQAKRVKPDADLLVRLADGYASLGEPALMISAFQRLEQADPEGAKAPEIQVRMGRARETLGQRDQAIAHYRAVLAHPNAPLAAPPAAYMTALERLQALLLAEGRLDEVAALHTAAAATLEDPAAQERLGVLKRDVDVARAEQALRAGKPGEAIVALQAALPLTPPEEPERRARAVALLMTAHARAGDGDSAKRLYKEEFGAGGESGYPALLANAVVDAATTQTDAQASDGTRAALVPVLWRGLDDLPPEQSAKRLAAARHLDGLYRTQGNHAARAALVTLLMKDGYDDATKRELRLRQGMIYRDWGQGLLEQKDYEGAQFQLERGLELVAEAGWRDRYELTALLSRAQLQRGQYGALILRNETLLPEIDDQALAGQVRAFLGQVYLQWGKAADEAENVKSARIRYGYALDYLPESDWQRRLAAAGGLATALQAQGQNEGAAAAYEAIMPHVADEGVRQQYALYLGRFYAERVGDPGRAGQWLKAADRGGNDPLSLEAGYLAADQQLAADRTDAGLQRLTELAGRGIGDTKWVVPIHYRIAIVHHQRKQLQQALEHYRIVAATEQAEARKVYPRSIEQSRAQVRQIEAFLKSGGGSSTIAVPKVRPE